MLLSVALPADDELENALENASYLLEKRSGFVASSDYAEEWRKKKDLYVFTAGSCFVNCFAGDIYDVSEGIDMQSRFLWGYHYEGLFKTLPGENMCIIPSLYRFR